MAASPKKTFTDDNDSLTEMDSYDSQSEIDSSSKPVIKPKKMMAKSSTINIVPGTIAELNLEKRKSIKITKEYSYDFPEIEDSELNLRTDMLTQLMITLDM